MNEISRVFPMINDPNTRSCLQLDRVAGSFEADGEYVQPGQYIQTNKT